MLIMGIPLIQIGQWADQVRCCSLKAEVPTLEKLTQNLKQMNQFFSRKSTEFHDYHRYLTLSIFLFIIK